jgi:hypothetical protein
MGSRHWTLTGVSDDLQLGEGGPRLIDAGGVVQVRDAAGTAFTRLQAAAPSDEDDVVTLKYLRTRADGVVLGRQPMPVSEDEVRRATARLIEGMTADGGGYILAPCHVLQTDVPTENILALSEAGFESGRDSGCY